jgi:hypothetical protein
MNRFGITAAITAFTVSACANQGPPRPTGNSQTIVINYNIDDVSQSKVALRGRPY